MTEQLNHELLQAALQDRPFRFFQQISSTNNVAEKWLLEDAPSGSVVIAEEQLSGRGRLSRKWQTPSQQAIAMSVIVRLDVDYHQLQRVTMAAGLAVAEALRNYTSGISLKWPNDVLLQGKKVCGILSEAQWVGEQLAGVIIGIGINVRVPFAQTDLADVATSIEEHSTQQVNRPLLIRTVLDNHDRWLTSLHADKLLVAYRENLATLGQVVSIQAGDQQVSGRAIDVDADGALLIEQPDGTQKRVAVGELAAQ